MGEKLEEPSYTVITSFNGVEVRRYTSTVQAKVRTAMQENGTPSNGFRRVAGYIFGGNQQGAQIQHLHEGRVEAVYWHLRADNR